ncbi:Ig-like domain-containing protein, partial [uncultured Clostridium sp.]|uniref:Ig-like domain-containing protein n=1 Tax=uncultured Clostridium sp. TaxID=59620 RepID=UPI0025ECF749
MFKTKYVSRVLCVLFIVNLFIADLKPLATSYSSSSIGNIDIISNVDVSVESVEEWAKSKNATETFVSLASIYKKYGQARGGVNWVLAYVQAAKETGYGRFGGVLDESFHNPCGLKVPSGGDDYDPNKHKRFDNWEQGIIAHLDHLALYAGAKGYPKTVYVESSKAEGLSINETYDPRHIGWFGTTSGILGKATNAIDLGNKWAPSSSYGVDLFRMYCDVVKADYLEGKSNLESPSNGMVITDGKLNIKGWALHAFGIKEIRVYIEGEQVGTLNVGITRSDVNQMYPGYYNGNNSGFEGSIDISRFGVGKKNVNVVIISTNNEVQSIKSNIIIGDKLQSIGNLEEPSNNETIVNNTLKIKGWALDSSGIKEVRAYIDEKDLGIIKYGISRVDVDKVYPGYINGSNSGFEGTINVSGIAKGIRKLIVKVIANDGTIQTFERTIRIENLESRSCLDEPTNNAIARGTLKISGWALASSGVKEVRVYVDGKDLGTISYGTKRTDVNNVYPGYSSGDNAGFNGTVNISSISNGNKKLTVKITSNDGAVQTIDRTIRIENLESRSCLDEPTNNAIARGT